MSLLYKGRMVRPDPSIHVVIDDIALASAYFEEIKRTLGTWPQRDTSSLELKAVMARDTGDSIPRTRDRHFCSLQPGVVSPKSRP